MGDLLPLDLDWSAPAIADASRLVGILEGAVDRQRQREDDDLPATRERLAFARRRLVEAALNVADGTEPPPEGVVTEAEKLVHAQRQALVLGESQ